MAPISMTPIAMTEVARLERRATSVLLAYVLSLLLVLTLSPFNFTAPTNIRIGVFDGLRETAVNFVLFIPLGYLYALRPARRGQYLRIALLGCLISLGIELTQLILPSRLTSISDLAANTLGCLAGGAICGLLSKYFNRARLGALVLELPSFNLLYLLVPLFWLIHLGRIDDTRVQVLGAILILTGAFIIGGLSRYRITPTLESANGSLGSRLKATGRIAALSIGWFAVAGFFAIEQAPDQSLGLAAVFALLVWLIPKLPNQQLRSGNRFEPVILGAVLSCLILFQIVAIVLPLDSFFNTFAATWGWPHFSFDRADSIRMAETIATASTIGYASAALLARWNQQPRRSVCFALAICAATSLGSELLFGFRADNQASVMRFGFCLAGGSAAIGLYWTQIDLLRAIRRQDADLLHH